MKHKYISESLEALEGHLNTLVDEHKVLGVSPHSEMDIGGKTFVVFRVHLEGRNTYEGIYYKSPTEGWLVAAEIPLEDKHQLFIEDVLFDIILNNAWAVDPKVAISNFIQYKGSSVVEVNRSNGILKLWGELRGRIKR